MDGATGLGGLLGLLVAFLVLRFVASLVLRFVLIALLLAGVALMAGPSLAHAQGARPLDTQPKSIPWPPTS